MSIGILAIFSAVLLSAVSAVFSVSGITTIFSGAALSAGVMGGVLEVSKIAATVWLYHFWKKANLLMKGYFFAAILVLIVISSLGIFGYLSKAYVGQSTATNQIDSRIERIERSIDREELQIERAEEQLTLLDQAIEQYIELNAVTRGLDRRQEQQAEREALNQIIRDAETAIAEYQDERLALRDTRNELEVNVGPIKYIAALLYGQDRAVDYYDDAARMLILLLVVVFDPFAVLLMVAGQQAIETRKTKRKRRTRRTKNPSPQPKPTPAQEPQPPSEVPPSNSPETVTPTEEAVRDDTEIAAHERNSITNFAHAAPDVPPKLTKTRRTKKA